MRSRQVEHSTRCPQRPRARGLFGWVCGILALVNRPAIIAALILFGGCSPAPVGSVAASVNGAVDDARDWPGVVLLQARKPEGIATCTAVLIAPNLLLTARHCVCSTEAALVCGASPLSAPVDGVDVLSTNDLTLSATSPVVGTVRVEVPPEGNDECGFDIAAVILAGEHEGAVIYPPRLDAPILTGETFTAVGYGTTGSGGLGTRRWASEVPVACVGGVDCVIPEVQPTEWMAGDDAFCTSDSGSGAIDSEGRLIGVVSKGIAPCTTPIVTSTYAFRDWIRSVGRMAADEGGYPTPAWALEPTADGGSPRVDAGAPADAAMPVAEAGGCSVARGSVRGLLPELLVLFALAMLARVRGRSASITRRAARA